MKAFTFLSLSCLAVIASAYPAKETVRCRAEPNISSRVVKSIPKHTDVKIVCQTTGQPIFGNNVWNKTPSGCYVADYYVKTGVDGFITDKCGSSGGGGGSGGGGKVPGPRVDDYPWKRSCGPPDRYLYFKCQCTSFVAWRINKRLGIKFHNKFNGIKWGNANTWDEAARATRGVKIDRTPKPGSIAQTNRGAAGHVAWVSAVKGNYVTIEEYNLRKVEGYGTRTVPKSSFDYYIHFN